MTNAERALPEQDAVIAMRHGRRVPRFRTDRDILVAIFRVVVVTLIPLIVLYFGLILLGVIPCQKAG